MNRPANWLVLCGVVILSPVSVPAEESHPINEQDMEFLEFLGEWETEGGYWVNPLSLLHLPSGEVERTSSKKLPQEESETTPKAKPEEQGYDEW